MKQHMNTCQYIVVNIMYITHMICFFELATYVCFVFTISVSFQPFGWLVEVKGFGQKWIFERKRTERTGSFSNRKARWVITS